MVPALSVGIIIFQLEMFNFFFTDLVITVKYMYVYRTKKSRLLYISQP